MHNALVTSALLASLVLGGCKMHEASASPERPAPPLRTSSTVADGATVSLESPYRQRAHVFRGQLHSHTKNSDGKQDAGEFMRAYKKAGYDFVAITDHFYATANPGVPGILFLHGMETEENCHHTNRIGMQSMDAAFPGRTAPPQRVIDLARAGGAFVQLNHPDWPGHFPANPCWNDSELLAVSGYDAVEVWNASNISEGNPNAELRIDMLLTHGKRFSLTAVDDCHDVHESYCLTSSVMVFADQLRPETMLAALKAGNFYASSGARISAIAVQGNAIEIRLPDPSDVEFVSDGGKVVAVTRGVPYATYAVKGTETYVRMRVTRAKDGKQAWSNPIYVRRLP